MGLDVDAPNPPDLTNRGLPRDIDPDEEGWSESDLYREEVEHALHDGAWEEAFNEWAEYTDLTEAESRILHDHGLFEALDIYWDPTEQRLRFEVPATPEGFPGDEEFASRATAEVADLAEMVVELLGDTYGDWSEEGPSEAVWTEEMYDEGTPTED